MQAKIDTLRVKDENDSEYLLYPKTLTKSVIDEDGNTLDNMLTDLEKRIGSSGSTGSGGSTSITVDTAMSDTSTNPVQNAVIKAYVDAKEVTVSAEDNNAIESKDDGIYVADKSAEIAQIQNDLAPITKYQKYVNTELDYCYCHLGENGTAITGTVMPFAVVRSNNMEMNTENHAVKLSAGKTYKLSADMHLFGSNTVVQLTILDVTNNTTLCDALKSSVNTDTSASCSAIYEPEIDCEVQVVATYVSASANYYGNRIFDYFIVEEINRQIVIDPLNYVNENQGIEDAPVGHIISFMGNNAPDHYIPCDGAEYNIADYPHLAQHFIDQFGTVNHFGGDGTTTFAVPDLRGEFLRGTGTALRNTGTGGAVGEHQDGTEHVAFVNYPTINNLLMPDTTSFHIIKHNADTFNAASAGDAYAAYSSGQTDVTTTGTYTSRPTNTAVLYCIKYEPTYFMVHKDYNTNYLQPTLYSEEERIVGCWINGKPLYEKTIKVGEIMPASKVTNYYPTYVENIDTLVDVYGQIDNGYAAYPIPLPYDADENVLLGYYRETNTIQVMSVGSWQSYTLICLTIQYTKTTDAEDSFTTQMIKDYAVAGYNNTVFPDYTNEIAKITTIGASYTATENCVATGYINAAASGAGEVFVDGVMVDSISSDQSYMRSGVIVYLKAGQVLSISQGDAVNLTIYGLQS